MCSSVVLPRRFEVRPRKVQSVSLERPSDRFPEYHISGPKTWASVNTIECPLYVAPPPRIYTLSFREFHSILRLRGFMSIKHVGVIGAGTMGNGIAHVFAKSGFQVYLQDVQETFLTRGMETIK